MLFHTRYQDFSYYTVNESSIMCVSINKGIFSFVLTGLVTMGLHFGGLAKVRHVITYSLSPFEQRAFPNYFSKGIPNVWRRFTSSFFRVAPREYSYLLYTSCKMHSWLSGQTKSTAAVMEYWYSITAAVEEYG